MHLQEYREILQRECFVSENFDYLLSPGHGLTFSQRTVLPLGFIGRSAAYFFRNRMNNHLHFRTLGWNNVTVDAVGSVICAARKGMIKN